MINDITVDELADLVLDNLLTDDDYKEIVQALKVKDFVTSRLGIEEHVMDEYVKENNEYTSDRYWSAVYMYKILTNILEDAKTYMEEVLVK